LGGEWSAPLTSAGIMEWKSQTLGDRFKAFWLRSSFPEMESNGMKWESADWDDRSVSFTFP